MIHRNEGIYIDGTVGVGKTTLIEILREKGFTVVPEPYLNNPLLDLFYQDKKRYSFASQVFFLTEKLKLIKDNIYVNNPVIDRSIYGDYLFAKMLYENGDMNEGEFKIYQNLFNVITEEAPIPKLIIYLDISVEEAMKRIQKRGRDYEQKVDKEYWVRLNKQYKEFFKDYTKSPLLKINVDNLDFEANEKDRQYIFTLLKNKLNNKIDLFY